MMKYKAQIIGVVWILMLCSMSMAQNQMIREIRIMDTEGVPMMFLRWRHTRHFRSGIRLLSGGC